MATAIIPLDFEAHPVRAMMVDGKPWWVAADACRVLEHSNPGMALKRLDEDQKGSKKVYTLGGEQTMNIVSLGGLLTLIARSNIPAARRFLRWITEEVVPALLRQGYYAMPGSLDAELADKRAYFATLPEAHRVRAEERAALIGRLEAQVAEGWKVKEAIAAACEESGLKRSTVNNLRKAVYMVPRRDWPAALAPRWSGDRGMLAPCDPDALAFYLNLIAQGARVSHALRRTAEVAAERGWALASDRTLRRQAKRALPTPSKQEAA
jgi:prophage antirepressor-like protein